VCVFEHVDSNWLSLTSGIGPASGRTPDNTCHTKGVAHKTDSRGVWHMMRYSHTHTHTHINLPAWRDDKSGD